MGRNAQRRRSQRGCQTDSITALTRARRLRELPPGQGGDVPAVALTAYARSEDREQALRAGFQMHLAKPVNSSELITVCAAVTGRLRQPLVP